MKIGILRETKIPFDKRVAITPLAAEKILRQYDWVDLAIQPCNRRTFSELEYVDAGVKVEEDLSDCDLLIGVKEVDKSTLHPKKQYLFFAHVGKMQEGNSELFRHLRELECSLYDYEYFVNENGQRSIAFGYWAGVVGAYNALVAMFQKHLKKELPLPQMFKSKQELFLSLEALQLPPWKILLTGTGRVGIGASDLFARAGVKKISISDFCTKSFDESTYCQLNSSNYCASKSDVPFDMEHFYKFPTEYYSTFLPYCSVADVIVTCHYWHPKAPKLFSIEDIKSDLFSVQVIADISCDIAGSVPCTLRSSTLDHPFYDYNPEMDGESAPFSSVGHVTMMSVDNLPNALARDASENFSEQLIQSILPHLLLQQDDEFTLKAKILEKGKLTEAFSYLEDYGFEPAE